jgi:hypothetical protein
MKVAVAVAGVATKRGLKALDIAIIALAAASLALVSVSVYAGAAPASIVVTSGAGEWIYPLSEDRTIQVEGLIGVTVVSIENGKARIMESPCENKTCIASPPVMRTGDWSACLPNGVFVRVGGSGAGDAVDATVR